MVTSRVGMSGCAALRHGAAAGLFLVLALTAGAASGGDNSAFVSYSDVPMRMEPGKTAMVTVTMRNTGTTTWATTLVRETTQGTVTTTRTSFRLGAVGDDWGVGAVAVSGSVAPNAPRSFRFKITAPTEKGTYAFQWKMARDTIVIERPRIPASPDWGFGAVTPRKLIVVGPPPPKPPPDTAPSFGKEKVEFQDWLTGHAIDPVDLPAATGGNGKLSYSLSCPLPRGVTRTDMKISGTPRTVWGKTDCVWKATDSDGNKAESDSAKLTFTIRARRAALAASPASLTVDEGGEGKDFTVHLAARPTGDVTIAVTTPSEDAGEVSVSPASLSFDRDDYRKPKKVTVTGPDDPDAEDETASVNLSASGGGFDGVSSSVDVTVEDDDVYGPPIVVPTSLKLGEVATEILETGGVFKVSLPTQPTGDVKVSLTVSEGKASAVTLAPDSLTFEAAEYATAQEVTVTSSQDADASDETVTVDVTAKDGGYDGETTSVAVDVEDDEKQALVVSPTSLTVGEGGDGTFEVSLATQPTDKDKKPAPVTVSVTVPSRDRDEVSVSPASLTFSGTDYGTPQPVTVNGLQDSDADDEAATLSLTASGADYGGVSASVKVTVKDDDAASLLVSPSSLAIGEGESGDFRVKLATRPTGAVSVSVSSGDPGAASASLESLSFGTVDYDDWRKVTVTGEQDADAADESTGIALKASGGGYTGKSASVGVTVADDDTRGLVASPRSLAVVEDGAGKTFTVKLATQPTGTGPVTVSVTSGDAGAVSVDPASLTFTTLNYGTPRTVTVKGVRDDDVRDESVTVALSASGGDYGGESASVAVTVDDRGEPGLVVEPTSLEMDEGGLAGFEVKLATRPTGSVTVSLSLPAAVAGKATVSPASLTFTASNHGAAQPVTVASEQDDDVLDETFAVALSASGGGYDGVSASVDVAVKDDDGPGLVVVPPVLEVREGGSEAFTVRLATQPTAPVTVSMSVASRDGVSASVDGPASLTFTTVNYAAPQTVTVPGEQDADSRDERMTVSLSASGGGYDGLTASVDVTVKDDDAPALVATPPGLNVGEGESATFTVRLATAPSDTVTVSVASGDTDAATVDLASLTFTATDYASAQTVTVAGVQDADAVGERTAVSLDASGGGYDDLSASVDVFVTDDDAAALAVSAAKVEVEEGESDTFTVALATQPSDTVTVSVASDDTDAATADPASLTFTATDYAAAQTVTVTGEKKGVATVALTGAGGDYDGVSAAVGVAVTAPDTSPVFGKTGDETFVKGEPVAVDLQVTGGNAPVECSAAPALPAGLALDASACTLSGTPTEAREQTEYTFTATDADGDTATLTFTIEVEAPPLDDASFVQYADLPSTMAAGSSATVTVRMRNEGTTTWTSADGYALGSQRPDDNATWGVSRVHLPAAAGPGETVDFTFEITAPDEAGAYPFRWKMVRGAAGWFGRKTALRKITVEDPSFGGATIPDQTWVKAEPIEALTLPEASGGGALTYALTPSPPDGVTFTESTRTLAGTPTALQAATEYAYTATDGGGGSAELRFTIEVEEASVDDASFVSVSGLPSRMAAGSSATVTVTMTNAGTTTWTSAAGYALGSWSPEDNETWGLSRAPLSGSVAPNEEFAFTFTITAPEATGSYPFSWRMARDPGVRFGSVTGDLTVTVEDPSFGDAAIADQTWARDVAIETLVLPAASGGDGGLTYALSPAPPDGVVFTASTRVLAGMPTTAQGATKYAYTATDEDGDAATLSFTIEVEAASADDASSVSVSGVPSRMAAGASALVTVTMKNTGTTTWTPAGGYGLGSRSSGKDTWGSRRAPLSGSVAPNESYAFTFEITAPETTGSYTFSWGMVRDPGMRFGAGTGDLTVLVEDPSFGDASIPDRTWVRDVAIETLVLPAASGGDGSLTYALSPAPPDGVIFTASARTLAGMPTTVQAARAYTYTATDEDGDVATLAFTITVSEPFSTAQSSTALAPGAGLSDEDMGAAPAPGGVFDMFEYWLAPHGKAVRFRARLGAGRMAAVEDSLPVRSFWRGDLWGRKVALLGDPGGERYDIFEEVEGGLDYWGTYEGGAAGGAAGGEDRPSWSLDRPFRWMNRFMAVGDALESRVTGRLLSGRTRNQEGVVETTMRLEVLSHRASFTVPAVEGPAFEDVLAVRFWPDAERPEAHDTFHLARGVGAVYWKRSGVAAPGEVVEWWAVEKALASVAPSAPSVPWFDPFSPGWPKTAVVNGNLEDASGEGRFVRQSDFGSAASAVNAASASNGLGGARVGSAVPGWAGDSDDAMLGRTPSGLAGGGWSLLLRGSEGGGDGGADAVTTDEWIPVQGGTYRLSACMMRENAADNVLVDFDNGKGRDADFADAHLVAASTGAWECRAVTKCIPASVGAVRIRAARAGANLGDAWFDRVELKRIAACVAPPGALRP